MMAVAGDSRARRRQVAVVSRFVWGAQLEVNFNFTDSSNFHCKLSNLYHQGCYLYPPCYGNGKFWSNIEHDVPVSSA